MADPVGVVGTTAGLVSLGLHLYSIIAKYFEALGGRKDDLTSAHVQLDTLRKSLAIIESALPRLELISGPGAEALQSAMGECKNELAQLDALLRKLVDSPMLSAKLKDRAKTLTFPFHRPSLMQLEDRLHKTNGAFQTALGALYLCSSLAIDDKISNLETKANQILQIEPKVAQLSLGVGDLTRAVGNINAEVDSAAAAMCSSNTTIAHLRADFESFAPKASSQLSNVQQSIGMLARQSDIREISTITTKNTSNLQHLTTAVHDLIATSDQNLPQISLNLSSINETLQKLPDLERILGTQELWQQTHLQAGVRRLLAKPGQMKEVYDAASPPLTSNILWTSCGDFSAPVLDRGKLNRCRCHCLRQGKYVSSRAWLASVWLRTETKRNEHVPSCRYSGVNIRKTSRHLEFIAAGHLSILSFVLQLSFAITTGAGGLSISPNITFRPIVDTAVSPVFRVLDQLLYFLFRESRWSDSEVSRFINLSSKTILRLYQKKMASPNDVSESGESILHKWASTYAGVNRTKLLDPFAKELVQAGVPANISDFKGRSPAMVLAGWQSETTLTETMQLLYDAASDSVFSNGNVDQSLESPRHAPVISTRVHAEIFGCGPLGNAVVAGDIETIRSMTQHESALLETNLLGQTPLHLATNNPEIFMILLHASEARTLNLRDKMNCHVIDYVIRLSGRWCRNGSDWTACSGCTCTDALIALLSIDGCFDAWLETGFRVWFYNLTWTSHSSRLRLLLELKHRREQLKALARSFLCDEKIQKFKLTEEDVLDHHADDVVGSLEMSGVEVPASLQVGIFPTDFSESYYGSLYHLMADKSMMVADISAESYIMAGLIHELGFRDLDEPDCMGCTPLLKAILRGDPSPSFVLWLVEHGADLTIKLSTVDADVRRCGYGRRYRNPDLTAAHMVFCSEYVETGKHPLDNHRKGSEHEKEAFASLIMSVSPIQSLDHCECYCTENGCSPASLLFLRLWMYFYRYLRHQECTELPGLIGSRIAEFFVGYFVDLTEYRDVCVSALRMLTFEALDMKHTCCKGKDQSVFSDDEVREIWDEEKHLVDLLIELQGELVENFDKLELDFNEFLISHWAPRIEKVLVKLSERKMSEEEFMGTESLGVKWDMANSSDTDSSAKVWENSDTMEYWVQQLRDISEP